jgi:hypothetical protein
VQLLLHVSQRRCSIGKPAVNESRPHAGGAACARGLHVQQTDALVGASTLFKKYVCIHRTAGNAHGSIRRRVGCWRYARGTDVAATARAAAWGSCCCGFVQQSAAGS